MTKLETSNELGGQILKQFGIDPEFVISFKICGEVGEPIVVTVERYVQVEGPGLTVTMDEYKLVHKDETNN